MATKRDEHFEIAAYILGILSIVFGILIQPVLGFGFSITGIILMGKNKSEFAKKSKKLNVFGFAINLVVIAVAFYLAWKNILPALPY
ncbi:MAG: hypothetical protein ABIH49_01915 [archaeon]